MPLCCCCGTGDGSVGRIPAPVTTSITALTDEGATYIDLPEDCLFVESSAVNEQYAEGTMFFPLQRGDEKHLYVYEATTDMTEAKLTCGPIKMMGKDEPEELTPFGTDLTSDGRMYIAVFNKNMIFEVDLPSGEVISQMEVHAPNDVCIDPLDETTCYVAGGININICCLDFTAATHGVLYKFKRHPNGGGIEKSVVKRGFTTLAGVEKLGEKLYATQLYDLVSVNPSDMIRSSRVEWRGNTDSGQIWLADNIQPFDNQTLIIPAYRTMSRRMTKAIKMRWLAACGNFCAQVATCAMQGESFGSALENPEVSLDFSLNDSKAPLRVILYRSDGRSKHFEIDLVQSHAKESTSAREYYFDANVTNVAHVKDKLVCVNFQQNRIMLLPDEPYVEGLKEPSGVTVRNGEDAPSGAVGRT